MRPRHEQPIPTLILRDLADGPATVHDLSEAVGIHIRNLRQYLRLLYANGCIRITGWEQRTGPALPVWAIRRNGAPDAPRPNRKTR